MAKIPSNEGSGEGAARVRRSLRPLPVHMAVANAEYAKMELRRQDGKTLITAMFEGIKRYQDHPFARAIDPLPVVFTAGQVRVFHAAATDPRAAVFVVPSMINRSHILDLLPDRSFVRWLAGQGMDAYLLDWGEPARDDGMVSMDAAIGDRLLPAMRAAKQAADGLPLFGLGYCMGGTLLAGAAGAMGGDLAGAAFLASPWDFHGGDRRLATQVQMGTPTAMQLMESRDVLPVNWIQSVFAAVNEERTVHKFAKFAAMDPDSAEAHLFVAVEDWLNDGLDLPAPLARTCIRDWYGDNLPGRGMWLVAGVAVDPAAIRCPALVIAPTQDRLVPADSALALSGKLRDATVLKPDCGHVAMMTGRRAEQDVWHPVADWVMGRV